MMKGFGFVRVTIFVIVLALLCKQHHARQARLCGNKLREALEILCGEHGGFNSKVKKAALPELDEYGYNDVGSEDDTEISPLYAYGNSPFMNKIYELGANALAKTRRRRQGIHDECCMKPCSVPELLMYCQN